MLRRFGNQTQDYRHTISFSLDSEDDLRTQTELNILLPWTTWKKPIYVVYIRFLLLWDTRLYLTLHNGLGCTHRLPFGNGLYTVCLEEFDETPTVVCARTWRLSTDWTRHSL